MALGFLYTLKKRIKRNVPHCLFDRECVYCKLCEQCPLTSEECKYKEDTLKNALVREYEKERSINELEAF